MGKRSLNVPLHRAVVMTYTILVNWARGGSAEPSTYIYTVHSQFTLNLFSIFLLAMYGDLPDTISIMGL